MQLLAGLLTAAVSAVIPSKIAVPGWDVCGSEISGISGFQPDWSSGGNTQSEIEGGMSFTTKQWGRPHLYLRFDVTLPELVRDNRYTIDFELMVTKAEGDDAVPEFAHQPGLLLWANTENTKSRYIRDYIWYEDAYGEKPEYFAFPEISLEGPSSIPLDGFQKYSASFTAPERYNDPTQALWVRLTLAKRAERDVVTFSVRNVCVRKPELSLDPPPALQSYSTKFQLTRPAVPDASEYEQANCPFNENGLVSWTSLGFFDSSSVKLPENTKVLLSRSDLIEGLRYEKIEVPESSSLVFNDEEMTLTVNSFLVYGKLLIGSPGCRVRGPIRIVFWGEKSDADQLGGFGSKGLAAIGLSSFVDMYGKKYFPTWTRLARKVRAGDDRVYLQHSVNWEAGQEVVLTTTIWDDTGKGTEPQNEVHTIKAISDDRLIVQFEGNMKYVHYAGTEYQGEVALLTRTVSMEGEPSVDGYGGHSIANNARSRFAGVSTRFMGQTNIEARYPFHFHLMGENTGSLISDCVARDTYFRCFTIHGTNDTLITENVAFNATGSCFYIEDGVEENNVFSHNLVAHVRPIGEAASGGSQSGDVFRENKNAGGLDTTDRRFPVDAAAAAYYISNAYNEFLGNVASGGWAGFSFPSLPNTVGVFKDERVIQPRSRDLKKFSGNTCHSSGAYWGATGCIYVGGELKMVGDVLTYNSGRKDRSTREEAGFGFQNWEGTLLWMKFENTLIYAANKGILHWGNRVEMDGFEMHDVARAATLFGEAWLNNGVVNGISGNVDADFENKHHDGFQFYDISVKSIVTNVEFRNYQTRVCASTTLPGNTRWVQDLTYCDPDPTKAVDGWSVSAHTNIIWSGLYHSDEFKPQQISATRGIGYENVDYKNLISFKIVNTGASRMFNFIDFDGSATQEGFPTIVGSNLPWWNICSDCRFESQWSVWLCPKQPVGIEEREVLHLKFRTPEISANNGGIESSGACQKASGNDYADWSNCDVGYMTLWGSGRERRTPITSNAGVTGLSGTGWFMELDGGSPKVLDINPEQVPIGSTFRFAIGYPAGTTFTITADHQWRSNREVTFTAAASLSELMNSKSESQYFFDGNTLFLFPRIPDDIQMAEGPKFDRGGAYVYSTVRTWTIRIVASCDADSKGFCSAKPSNVLPPWNEPCPSRPTVTSGPTVTPTSIPTNPPTAVPTDSPTAIPTNSPTSIPTNPPTANPTNSPTLIPTNPPTAVPTDSPTAIPTNSPTLIPTNPPTAVPTDSPTSIPTNPPTANPTNSPTLIPTNPPTAVPTDSPTSIPTNSPTAVPTNVPTAVPPGTSVFQVTISITLRGIDISQLRNGAQRLMNFITAILSLSGGIVCLDICDTFGNCVSCTTASSVRAFASLQSGDLNVRFKGSTTVKVTENSMQHMLDQNGQAISQTVASGTSYVSSAVTSVTQEPSTLLSLDDDNTTTFPDYAIAVIVVGIVIILGIGFYYVWRVRNREVLEKTLDSPPGNSPDNNDGCVI